MGVGGQRIGRLRINASYMHYPGMQPSNPESEPRPKLEGALSEAVCRGALEGRLLPRRPTKDQSITFSFVSAPLALCFLRVGENRTRGGRGGLLFPLVLPMSTAIPPHHLQAPVSYADRRLSRRYHNKRRPRAPFLRAYLIAIYDCAVKHL